MIPRRVSTRGPQMLGPKALLFVPEKDWRLSKKLKDFRLHCAVHPHHELLSLFNMVCAQFRMAKQESNAENDSLAKALPAIERIITQATAACAARHASVARHHRAVRSQRGGRAADLHHLRQGCIYLVTAQRRRGPEQRRSGAAAPVSGGDADGGAGLNVGITGEPVGDGRDGPIAERHHRGAIVSLFLSALILFTVTRRRAGR